MKMQFTLKNVTGSAIFARFAAAINEEGVGFDPDFDSSAVRSRTATVQRSLLRPLFFTMRKAALMRPLFFLVLLCVARAMRGILL